MGKKEIIGINYPHNNNTIQSMNETLNIIQNTFIVYQVIEHGKNPSNPKENYVILLVEHR